VARAIEALGHETELVTIRTAGDRSAATSFSAIGPFGVFVREIEQALLEGRVELAVHSCKDLPSRGAEGLVLAAIPQRLDAADVLLMHRRWFSMGGDPLPIGSGASIGTSSVRRQTWIRHMRSDLRVVPLRGNVPTRIERLRAGDHDAIVLAAAGLERLAREATDGAFFLPDRDAFVTVRLDPREFVPAPAQGALAVQCREDDAARRDLLSHLDHSPTRGCVEAERTLLSRVEGGCEVAFGAYCAEEEGSECRLAALIERDGALLRASATGPDPAALTELIWSDIAPREMV